MDRLTVSSPVNGYCSLGSRASRSFPGKWLSTRELFDASLPRGWPRRRRRHSTRAGGALRSGARKGRREFPGSGPRVWQRSADLVSGGGTGLPGTRRWPTWRRIWPSSKSTAMSRPVGSPCRNRPGWSRSTTTWRGGWLGTRRPTTSRDSWSRRSASPSARRPIPWPCAPGRPRRRCRPCSTSPAATTCATHGRRRGCRGRRRSCCGASFRPPAGAAPT